MSKSADLLQEQIEYYRERALEYDEWFFRQGRYDRGEAHRKQWFAEIAEVVYQVVKIFHEPTQLEKSLKNLGWFGRIHSTPTHFIYGSLYPREPQP